ncbi:MAG TPA: CDP-alcohol phosphatidyltransferase family protein [Vicinamibacterales bacterium]|nr:CDP-alcohol phosphatidyltransferase family protein [Vicinamibacterales bacterium]
MLASLTAANQLTLLRMALIPAFVIFLLYGYSGWGLLTLVFAGITDGLDGLIARRTGQKTTLGAWLDPMADKLLLVTTFIMLTLPGLGFANRLPIWLTVLVISRDVAIVLAVAVVNFAIGRRTFLPSIYGKIATATYIVTGVVTLTFNYLNRPSALVTICVYGSLFVTIVSGVHYVRHGLQIIKQHA